MRRIRIAIVGASPCGQCDAACCKQNGHDFAVLLEEDEIRKFAAYSIGVQITTEGMLRTERVIPYVDRRCPFLASDDRCTIYEDRPMSCRSFQCTLRFNRFGVNQHDRFVDLNPRVLQMLEAL